MSWKKVNLLVQLIGQIEGTWLLTPPACPIWWIFQFFGKNDLSIKSIIFCIFPESVPCANHHHGHLGRRRQGRRKCNSSRGIGQCCYSPYPYQLVNPIINWLFEQAVDPKYQFRAAPHPPTAGRPTILQVDCLNKQVPCNYCSGTCLFGQCPLKLMFGIHCLFKRPITNEVDQLIKIWRVPNPQI